MKATDLNGVFHKNAILARFIFGEPLQQKKCNFFSFHFCFIDIFAAVRMAGRMLWLFMAHCSYILAYTVCKRITYNIISLFVFANAFWFFLVINPLFPVALSALFDPLFIWHFITICGSLDVQRLCDRHPTSPFDLILLFFFSFFLFFLFDAANITVFDKFEVSRP